MLPIINAAATVQTKHPTTDNWAPSFEAPEDGCGGFVVCVVDRPRLSVSFWGADDTYSKRYFTSDEEVTRFLARIPSIVTKSWLLSVGFLENI